MKPFFESLRLDARYALRGMAHSPGFTLMAILAAALGIGATTAVFSVVDRILFRGLPYPQDDRLVSLGMMTPLDTIEFVFPDAYFGWRKQQQPFEAITSFTAGVVDCDLSGDVPVRAGCSQIEGSFLPTFRIAPLLGRNFAPEEDRRNAPKVALISYGLWKRKFSGDPAVAGKVISLDGQPVTIIGVLPASFEMPTLARPDILLPEALNEATEKNGRALRLFARLKPGVSIPQAAAAMQPLFEESLKNLPAGVQREVHLQIRSLRDRQIQDARLASWVLFGAVGAVLLIACANIANLLLARSSTRRRELAVRAALGASRARLIRQTLTESLLLGVIGGGAGCLLAWALLRFFIGIAPNGIPRLEQATIDDRVLWFALAASVVSGLVFGIAPAIQRQRSESITGWRAAVSVRALLRESLVAAQIAVSLVLLTSAAMLLRSLWKLENVALGIQSEHVVIADFTLSRLRYSPDTRQIEFFDELERRLNRIPGAAAVTTSDSLPPSGGTRSRPLAAIQVEGQPPMTQGTGGMVVWRYVTPGYFAALGIPIRQGRGFTTEDRSPGESAIVLSESLARKLFPDGNALGKRLRIDTWFTVVGVASDVKNAGPSRPSDPEYYALRKPVPDEVWRNQMQATAGWRRANVAVRTSLDPNVLADWIKNELASLDATLPVNITTMDQKVSGLVRRPRFNAVLLSLFAVMGVLLAVIGLYGVMAFLVGQRTQEIGVRMALGATPGAITKLVLGRAMQWTLSGLALGTIGSAFAMKTLQSVLFQVPETDPMSIGAALAAMVLVAVAAAWIPSRRAARIDPMAALRHE